jgi:hypothetical protein
MANEILKKDLERILKIHSWNPTDSELERILIEFNNLLARGLKLNIATCHGVIIKYCSNVIFRLFESVDNSDLNALLSQAMKKTKK